MQIRGKAQKVLAQGDRLTCSVSHEIKIDGETSWVKFESSVAVQDNETDEQAIGRVITLTDQAVMSAVHTVVATVKGN